MVCNLFAAALLAGLAFASPQGYPSRKGNTKGYPFVDPLSDYKPPPNPYNTGGEFINWRTYKSNGVNLGSWLEKERTHDPIWWVNVGGVNVSDEWSLCQTLGKRCGPVFEARYASFLNLSTIDTLASVGVNTLRIPLTYAAWVKVPSSELYSGNQVQYLDRIVSYAVQRYNMHIIIGLHSLPGGVNSLDIGEAIGHDEWFFNQTHLEYSWLAIDRVLDYIKTSPLGLNKFSISPLNEASDTNLVGFGTPAGLTDQGADWINKYLFGVLDRIKKVDSRIPMIIQDNFKGTDFWAPFFNATDNVVISPHVYYFAAAGVYANYVNPAVCGQAQYIANQTKFPNFVGEWSLQTRYNNTFAGREEIFNTQRYAWNEYLSGGTFWTAVSYATSAVEGEGTQREYWSYVDLINQGVIKPVVSGKAYC
ncbi:glycoside hydrolase family 5 protein [Macroventuria anomochaeta]|uniref:Glycoside hydrolase family 5 protein n=1 Tax=Macroventuria anomochaeta TaxID=301207 RepID=A0ACB6RW16_9PLEO|nr:glycoside hydrolase family 5 protein [Macroventuria anomochaeta]KAF2625615.1 glycoside hydrolase family 5 protein [Macroventuria anomochaeta]